MAGLRTEATFWLKPHTAARGVALVLGPFFSLIALGLEQPILIAAIWFVVLCYLWETRAEIPTHVLGRTHRSAQGRVLIRMPVDSDLLELRRIVGQPANVAAHGHSNLVIEASDKPADSVRRALSLVAIEAEHDQIIGLLSVQPGQGFDAANPEASIGITFDQDVLGRGLATEAVGAAIGHWSMVLDRWALHIETAATNEPMQALARRLGFESDGTTHVRELPDGRKVQSLTLVPQRPFPPEYEPELVDE